MTSSEIDSAAMLNQKHEPVAIVGMGCRWPGSVQNPTQLWELLRDKRDGYREFAEPRFSAKGFYHPNPDRPGTVSTQGGFLVDDDPRQFDHGFFGMTGLEVETLDPSQRKLLEVVYEAFENGGETWESISGSRTGVFIGNFSLDHWVMQARDWDFPRPYATTGAATSILANRLSYLFNLQGPSLAIDTACSSSMYAVHMAVNAIRNGDCDSAIVAAANWILDPGLQIGLNKLGALSPTSRCHTFDVSADGYARGEGCAALFIRSCSTAVAKGSPIRAVIRGTAVNANGRTGGITRPSAAGQEAVIRQAYHNAGNLPFSETAYFECHGTGTPVGDPIEVTAVGNVFSPTRGDTEVDDRLLIGSVKTNLGHSEGASALAAIMKVVLSLEEGQIPPSFGVQELNPNVAFDKAKVNVVQELTSWPKRRLRRASINSFGFGGANGHCIIDHINVVLPQYAKPGIRDEQVRTSISVRDHNITNGTNGSANGRHSVPGNDLVNDNTNSNGTHARNGHTNRDATEATQSYSNGHKTENNSPKHVPITQRVDMESKVDCATRQSVILPFSAHSEGALEKNIQALASVTRYPSMADIAYTISMNRSRLPKRTFRIIDKDDVLQGLGLRQQVFESQTAPAKIGFVFTGQGAQWHAMGAQLFEYGVFNNTIEYLDYILRSMPIPPHWRLSDILSGNCDEGFVQQSEISQAACTALQIGLVDLLASWGVRPSGVAGHSSGEMAAAYASGRISAAAAIVAAYFRGRAVSRNNQTGAMLAVGLGPDDALRYLSGREDQIKVAAINSPGSVTLSGDEHAVAQISAALTADNVFNRLLRTSGNAYHSHHMVPLGETYDRTLSGGLNHIANMGLNNACYAKVPWCSSVTPSKTMLGSGVTSQYWRANLESPVRFCEAVTKLLCLDESPIDIILEVGPHAALKSPLDQIIRSLGKSVLYCSTLKREEDPRESMLKLAGTLFGMNGDIDMVAVNSVDLDGPVPRFAHGCTTVKLPPYQYSYGPIIYNESRVSKEYRLRKVIRHDLLGSKVPGTAKLRPQWRNILRVKDVPWLADHRLIPDAVYPAAAYITMAIEAATRIHNEYPEPLQSIVGFQLRNVNIKTALRIPEDDYGVEVVFSMELVETAGSPAWVSFSVSSVSKDSNEWTEHCNGSVKIEASETAEMVKTDLSSTEIRKVNSRAWYKKFAAIGLGYGPTFQGLSEIGAAFHDNRTTAQVDLKPTIKPAADGNESAYPLHPCSLDAAFQLGLIACHAGRIEKASTAFVPIHLDNIYVRNGNDEEVGFAVAKGELRGLRGAYVKLQMMNKRDDVVLNIDNLRCISYSSEGKQSDTQIKPFSSPFTRIVWKPDIRALNNRRCRELFPPPKENISLTPRLLALNRLASLIVFDIYDTFAKAERPPTPSGNVGRFYEWIKRRVDDETEFMQEAKQLPSQQRNDKIQELYSEMEDNPEAQAVVTLHQNMSDILDERVAGVDLLVEKEILGALYETGIFMTSAYPQFRNLIDSLGHATPDLNILELGAGTGGATHVALEALTGPNGIKRYSEYTFTDISPGFLAAARESMAAFTDMKFSVLDIENDPLEQGYEPVYDLIVASQTLHATASVDQTLANCSRLLKPGGKLLLVENTRDQVLVGLVLGTLTGYWHGISDGRLDSPFLTRSAWDAALKRTGFSGTDIILDDYAPPNNTTTTLMSTFIDSPMKVHAEASGKLNGEVELIYDTVAPPALLTAVSRELQKDGVSVKEVPYERVIDTRSTDLRVVAFLGNPNFLLESDPHHLETLQYLAGNTKSMLCITSSGIIRGRNPEGSLLAGLLRTIGTENPAGRFRALDVDADGFNIQDDNLVRSIIQQEKAMQQESLAMNEDREFVWQDGCLWVSRVVPDAVLSEHHARNTRLSTPKMLPLNSRGPVRAAFEVPGILSSLYFREYTELKQALPPDWLDVKVAAVGLNWKDLGLCSGRFDGSNLSSEYTGIISAIGSAVTDFAVGDHVYGTGKGHFGNYTRVRALSAYKLQPSDDLLQMATMPLVYMTAIYAFEHLAHISKGKTVLIQSATGGLGLAAIQLAQSRGAEVFATVGTEQKAKFLVDKMKMKKSAIFSSRDGGALSRAAQSTGKAGFNIILSTARGDLLHASLQALAPHGHLIDVGRMDVTDSKAIGLELFQKNANFSSFDLSLLLDSDPDLGAELMRSVDQYYRAGLIGPIDPCTATDVSQLDKTLLAFSKGTHIGKLVVNYQNADASLVRMVPSRPVAQFSPDACYIITGGLGGLGRSIASWMGDRGARHLVILSRRGIKTPGAPEFVEHMRLRGVNIEAAICDVGRYADVTRAIQDATTYRPLKGIIHAAVSYLDISFDKMTSERWQQSLAAKVAGTKNLHEATLETALDFYIMVTSIESICALATQSAYTTANNFQDHFARYRRRLGLPATAASFGFINDVGMLSSDSVTVDLFARNKVLTITEHQFLDLLELVFLKDDELQQASEVEAAMDWVGRQQDPLSAASVVTCMDPAGMVAKERDETEACTNTNTVPRWYGDGRVSLIMRAFADAQRHSAGAGLDGGAILGDAKSAVTRLRQEFSETVQAGDVARAIEIAKEAITKAVADLLFIETSSVNPAKTIADHGVDSLIAAELRNWFHQVFSYNISMMSLLDANTTIADLGATIVGAAFEKNE